ncbi:GNAT family N-acetyltransferase [Paraburkholderia susongensis]|nr:GNAT family N-acetyltransferase [Paraburkholderia susongensis]
MLVAQGPHMSRAIASAWETASKRCGADIFMVPYVDVGTPLHEHASRHPRIMATSGDVSMKAVLPRFEDWDTFCASLGMLEKKRPGARHRRLSREGVLVARKLEPEESDSFDRWVAWILASKREWASSRGKASSWLVGSAYHNYLMALLNSTDEQSKAHLFIITLDAVPIASSIVGMGKACVTDLIGAFDKRYAKFEPGLLVREVSMKRAFDLGLDVDFGVGTERFKAYWSRKNITQNESFEIAATPLGALAFHVKRLIRAAKTWRGARAPAAAPAIPLDAKPAAPTGRPPLP